MKGQENTEEMKGQENTEEMRGQENTEEMRGQENTEFKEEMRDQENTEFKEEMRGQRNIFKKEIGNDAVHTQKNKMMVSNLKFGLQKISTKYKSLMIICENIL